MEQDVPVLKTDVTMDFFKKRLSHSKSSDSIGNGGSSANKARGRRGGFTLFHVKKANLTKELMDAAKNGDATKLREFLDGGVEIEDMDELDKPFRMACENGHLEVVATLIRFGAPVNRTGDNSQSPLHVATRKGCLSIMTLLISNGANVNMQSKFEKRTPMHVAALSGKEDSMKTLIEAADNIEMDPKDIYGTTPMHLAARMGHVHIVKLLLGYKKKVNINGYDNDGWTALHLAAERGDTEMTKFLLDHFAQVDCQNKYGRTPLHWATIKGHLNIVRILLQFKASSTIKDLHDKSSIEYANDAAIRQILKMTDSAIFKSKNPTPESTIGTYMKIDPRESFIRRIGKSVLGKIVKDTSQSKKTEQVADNLNTITEERMSEVSGSRRNSLHSLLQSEDEAFVDSDTNLEDSVSLNKENTPLFNTIFPRYNKSNPPANSSAPSSQRNSQRSMESSIEPEYLTETQAAPTQNGAERAPLDRTNSVTSSITPSMSDLKAIDISEEFVPEAAVAGRSQFSNMMKRIHRHHQTLETIINSVSIDVARAVTGHKSISSDNLMNISNRLHKLQDMMFDFREENEHQSTLLKNTMNSFLVTIRTRLSPFDVLPIWLYQAFIHATTKYLSKSTNGCTTIIQKIPSISEEKRSDMLQTLNKLTGVSAFEKASVTMQHVLSVVSPTCESTPLKSLLVLITKCNFEQNSAQLILKDFIQASQLSPEQSLQHSNLYIISYRLGGDGEMLAKHLGIPFNQSDKTMSKLERQESNLAVLSKWRMASVKASPCECVYDLTEGLIGIGREDLLLWILTDHRTKSDTSANESSC